MEHLILKIKHSKKGSLIYFEWVHVLPVDCLRFFSQLLGKRLGHRHQNKEQIEDGDRRGQRDHKILAVEAAQVGAERRARDETGGKGGRDEAVRGGPIALVCDVSHVGEHHTEGDSE